VTQRHDPRWLRRDSRVLRALLLRRGAEDPPRYPLGMSLEMSWQGVGNRGLTGIQKVPFIGHRFIREIPASDNVRAVHSMCCVFLRRIG
jgi:hypothetical protein